MPPAPEPDPSDREPAGEPRVERAREARRPRGAGSGTVGALSVRGGAWNGRFSAATELLADDSPAVRDAAWRELEAGGKAALGALRRASGSSDAKLRARARAVLAARAREGALRRLLAYALRPSIDLETGLFLLGHLDRPRLDARPYRRALDAMAAEVRRRAAREPSGGSLALVLGDHLGRELGFRGEAGPARPADVFLHRAIERRRGLPLTLVALHLCVARRAGVRAAAIALPGHVLLRVHSGARSVLVDPFRGGELRTRRECVAHLRRHGFAPDARWFRAATDAELLQRQVLNLMHVHRHDGRLARARELRALALVLEGAATRAERRGGSRPES